VHWCSLLLLLLLLLLFFLQERVGHELLRVRCRDGVQ
jgi:hypothetical protein